MQPVQLRLAAILLTIAVYSGGILSLNSVVLPAAGVNGLAELGPGAFDFIAPNRTEAQAGSANREHGWGASRTFSLWLRPFGVHRPDADDLSWALGSFAVLGTVSTMLLFLFPKRVRYVSKLLRDEPFRNHVLNVLVGLLAYGVAYALLRLSWLMIMGVPFIPFLVGGVWLLTMMGIVAVSFTLGRALLRYFDAPLPPLAEVVIGLWLLFVTSMLPVLGWLVGGVCASLGFGALLQTRFGTRQRWSLDPLEEPAPAPEPQPRNPKILPLRRAR